MQQHLVTNCTAQSAVNGSGPAARAGIRKLVPVLAKVDRERCKDRWSGFLVSERMTHGTVGSGPRKVCIVAAEIRVTNDGNASIANFCRSLLFISPGEAK